MREQPNLLIAQYSKQLRERFTVEGYFKTEGKYIAEMNLSIRYQHPRRNKASPGCGSVCRYLHFT